MIVLQSAHFAVQQLRVTPLPDSQFSPDKSRSWPKIWREIDWRCCRDPILPPCNVKDVFYQCMLANEHRHASINVNVSRDWFNRSVFWHRTFEVIFQIPGRIPSWNFAQTHISVWRTPMQNFTEVFFPEFEIWTQTCDVKTRFDWINRSWPPLNFIMQNSYLLKGERIVFLLLLKLSILLKNQVHNDSEKRRHFWYKSRKRKKLAISKVN